MPSRPRILRPSTPRLAGLALALCCALVPLVLPAATYRYARNENTIYIENGGSATLSAAHAALPDAPLRRVGSGIWFLGADIVITNGSALQLHGKRAGGDVDELRLKSANSAKPGSIVSITADYGHIDLRKTRVISWDPAADAPDEEYATYGRAFIRARSRLRAGVLNALQSRMDIVDSEVGWLGYNANESYGLVWKVVAPAPYVFDYVRVYGNIINSRIHHNYFGVYTSGAKLSEWRGNEIFSNIQYGLAPHNRSDDLVIENNDVHHNGHHGITARLQCERITVRNNRVWANGETGIWLHRGANDAIVTGNRVFMNRDGGITLHAVARAVVRDNVVLENGHVGLQLTMGTTDSRVSHNEIGDNGFYGVFVGKGKGRPARGDGLPRRNRLTDNVLYGAAAEDLRMGDPALNRFAGNTLLVYEPEELAATDDAPDLFTNPPRSDAPLRPDLARAAALPATAPLAAARTAESDAAPRHAAWQMPPALLWAGAACLVATLLLMNGAGSGSSRH